MGLLRKERWALGIGHWALVVITMGMTVNEFVVVGAVRSRRLASAVLT